MAPKLTGGVKISTATQSMYNNEAAGDILVYTGTHAQNMLVGPSNATGQSTMKLKTDLATVYTDFDVQGLTTTKEILIGVSAGPIAAGSLTGNYVFNNPATFNATTSLLASNTNVSGCNLVVTTSNSTFTSNVFFSGNVLFKGSNSVCIGEGPNSKQYPLYVQAVGSNGISVYVQGDHVSLSDSRFKKDIRPITNAIDKVNLIGGYTFAWANREEDYRVAGVIAQEVQEVLPEVVRNDDDGKLSVAYGNLSALLIQAIKELSSSKKIVKVTTTMSDEDFSIDLPQGNWTMALVSGGAQYVRSYASVISRDGGQSVVGRVEVPGTYSVLIM